MGTGDLATAILALLPKYDAGLHIERNPGRGSYQTVAEWLESSEREPDFTDDYARQRAIDTNDVWVMQWYPSTPVGFQQAAAPTLGELLEFVAAQHD